MNGSCHTFRQHRLETHDIECLPGNELLQRSVLFLGWPTAVSRSRSGRRTWPSPIERLGMI